MKITFWRAGAVFLLFCFYGTYLVFLQAAPQVALLGASEWADFPNGAGVKTNRFHTLRVLNFPDGIWQYRLRHWTEKTSSGLFALGVGNNGAVTGRATEKSVFSMITIHRVQ